MHRKRHELTWLPAAVLVTTALLIAGCGGKQEASDPLSAIPQDVDALVKIDVKKLMSAPAVKEAVEEKGGEGMKEAEELGIDVEKDINWVAFGLSVADATAIPYVVIEGTFKPDKIHEKLKERSYPDKTQEYKGNKIFVVKEEDNLAMSLVGNNLLLASKDPETVKGMIDRAATGEGGVQGNKKLADAIAVVSPDSPITGAVLLTQKMKEQLGKNPMTLPFLSAKSFALEVDLPDGGFALKAIATCGSPDGANGITSALTGLKGMMKQGTGNEPGAPASPIADVLDALAIETQGNNSVLDIQLTKQQIDKLVEQGIPAPGGPPKKMPPGAMDATPPEAMEAMPAGE